MWLTGPVAPWHVGSSQTRARTRVPCIGRQILNHCATREAPIYVFEDTKVRRGTMENFSSRFSTQRLIEIFSPCGNFPSGFPVFRKIRELLTLNPNRWLELLLPSPPSSPCSPKLPKSSERHRSRIGGEARLWLRTAVWHWA